MSVVKLPPKELTLCYNDGLLAGRAGKPDHECPYKGVDDKTRERMKHWLMGHRSGSKYLDDPKLHIPSP